MDERKVGRTEIRPGWIKKFEDRRSLDATARRTWEKLIYRGCQERALLYLLYGYAGGADSEIDALHDHARELSYEVKAAILAGKIAKSSSPRRAKDSSLFHRRAEQKREYALGLRWPAPTEKVESLGKELVRVEQETGRKLSLTAVRRAVIQAVGKRSPINRMYFLMLLQGYAAKHGTRLGAKRLCALANCACERLKLNARVLARYLARYPAPRKVNILLEVLPTLASL